MLMTRIHVRPQSLARTGALLALLSALVGFPSPAVAENAAARSGTPPAVVVPKGPPLSASTIPDSVPGATPASPGAANHPSEEPGPRPLSMFFIIGIAINLVMVVLISVWAYRELRRQRKPRQP